MLPHTAAAVVLYWCDPCCCRDNRASFSWRYGAERPSRLGVVVVGFWVSWLHARVVALLPTFVGQNRVLKQPFRVAEFWKTNPWPHRGFIGLIPALVHSRRFVKWKQTVEAGLSCFSASRHPFEATTRLPASCHVLIRLCCDVLGGAVTGTTGLWRWAHFLMRTCRRGAWWIKAPLPLPPHHTPGRCRRILGIKLRWGALTLPMRSSRAPSKYTRGRGSVLPSSLAPPFPHPTNSPMCLGSRTGAMGLFPCCVGLSLGLVGSHTWHHRRVLCPHLFLTRLWRMIAHMWWCCSQV